MESPSKCQASTSAESIERANRFKEFYVENELLLYSQAWRALGFIQGQKDKTAAKDIAHNAVVKFLESGYIFNKNPEEWGPLMLAIVKNEAVDHLRKYNSSKDALMRGGSLVWLDSLPQTDTGLVPAELTYCESEVDEWKQIKEIQRILDSFRQCLSPTERQVYCIRKQVGKIGEWGEAKAVAARMHVDPQVIRKHLSNIRKKAAEHYKRLDEARKQKIHDALSFCNKTTESKSELFYAEAIYNL